MDQNIYLDWTTYLDGTTYLDWTGLPIWTGPPIWTGLPTLTGLSIWTGLPTLTGLSIWTGLPTQTGRLSVYPGLPTWTGLSGRSWRAASAFWSESLVLAMILATGLGLTVPCKNKMLQQAVNILHPVSSYVVYIFLYKLEHWKPFRKM